MNESVFNFYIPATFIRFLSKVEAQLLEGIRQQDPEVWSSEHGVSRKRQISFHLSLISYYRSQLRFIENYKGPGFRASTMKKDQNYQFIPINCHLQEMLAASRSMKGGWTSFLLFNRLSHKKTKTKLALLPPFQIRHCDLLHRYLWSPGCPQKGIQKGRRQEPGRLHERAPGKLQ